MRRPRISASDHGRSRPWVVQRVLGALTPARSIPAAPQPAGPAQANEPEREAGKPTSETRNDHGGLPLVPRPANDLRD